MNGPEHYAEAERILEQRSVPGDGGDFFPGDPDQDGVNLHGNAIAAAQVHATLALAAAVANTEPTFSPLAERPTGWDNGRKGDGATWKSVTA